uniref:Uncharacterized protein n=1 Tax=Strongyloides venezuelensis TaxID=75913 RepID=A0A0K0FIZ8_STRVS
MAGTERKVLQKYYTPGFDGSKVSRIRKKKSTYFMERATDINMKRETAHADDYLGLKFFRFTFSLAEVKVKRDLENTDYTTESGATRNINFNLKNLIEQKASSITDDVKAQEKEDEELLDSLFGNKDESLSSTKIFEEIVGEIIDSGENSDDELRHHYS